MIRVLHVYPQLNNAGTEMVIMNLYRHIDRSRIQFDFLIQRPGELDERFRALGAQIYCIGKSTRYASDVFDFFRTHPEYRIVHTHTHAEMGTVLQQAHHAGVMCRIAHSHNHRGDLPRLAKCWKLISSWTIEHHATHFIACSEEAADWLFPRKHKRAQIWHNGIELERFRFSEQKRHESRRLLGIPADARVVCHVGRFARQKNHRRIISLLNQLTQLDEGVYGLLIGTGPLREKMQAAAKNPHVLFPGNRTDVAQLLSAADVFLFPSLYEGLGIAVMEAQASGLPCVASATIPSAADAGVGLFTQLPLSAPDHEWLALICNSFGQSTNERLARSEQAMASHCSVHVTAEKAQQFYLSLEE